MKELQKFMETVEQSEGAKNRINQELNELENDIAKKEIEYIDLLKDNELEQASSLRNTINNLKNTATVKRDMLQIMNDKHISKEVQEQADKVIDEAITNIQNIRKDAAKVYEEYEQKRKELTQLTKRIDEYNSMLHPYIKACEDIGKRFPHYAKQKEAVYSVSMSRNEPPKLKNKYSARLRKDKFYTLENKYGVRFK